MRISVALTTRNGSRFLPQQLASLAAQRRPPDELVVRDDGSSDATPAILADFAARAAFPVEIEHGERWVGSTPSFESVLRRCSGDVIALCDQDDVWRPDKLEAVEEAFHARPDAGLVFSNAELIDGADRPLPHTLWQLLRCDAQGRWMLRRGGPDRCMLTRFSAPGCTLAFRSAHVAVILPFPEQLRSRRPPMHHDRWILTMAVSAAPAVALEENLVAYRIHPDQQVGLGPFLPFRRTRLRAFDVVRRAGGALRRVPGVRGLVVELVEPPDPGEAEAMVGEFLHHWQFRQGLPVSRVRRLGPVLWVWRRGDYHRFANGVWSVGADLLRP
jgi:glycosyltransferase involved in cell wall biosynthesis